MSLLSIVCSPEHVQINEEVLRQLCINYKFWKEISVNKNDFVKLESKDQDRLIKKFYVNLTSKTHTSIDSSIGKVIQNTEGISMQKVLNKDGLTEMKVTTIASDNKEQKKERLLWKEYGCFDEAPIDFKLEKPNLPENTLFYINQGYQTYKDSEKIYYTDICNIEQILPISDQPKNIDDYELRYNEVKILIPIYDKVSSEFLGIKYNVAEITIRNDPHEMFLDYGYKKDSSNKLYCTEKSKVPNCFSCSTFSAQRKEYESGVNSEQDFSKVFFWLPSTVDRSEKVNKCMTSVYLKPFYGPQMVFGKKFNPANIEESDREILVDFMKRIAKQSSQNLKRNVDVFLSKSSKKHTDLI